MQHTALLPAGTSPLVTVTLWVKRRLLCQRKNTCSLPHPGDNFRAPVIAICPLGALLSSLGGDFLVQMLILTS